MFMHLFLIGKRQQHMADFYGASLQISKQKRERERERERERALTHIKQSSNYKSQPYHRT